MENKQGNKPGSQGGQKNPGNFANDRQKASDAGRKGGQSSSSDRTESGRKGGRS